MLATSHTTIIHNARIYAAGAAQALVIVGERIAYVGDEAGARAWHTARSELIDAGGRLLLPGLVDSHMHLLGGARALAELQLDDSTDLRDCLQRIAAYADAHPQMPWISGRGWRYALFAPGTVIHRELLDAIVPDRPVYLTAFDGHTAWANTRALQQGGILQGGAAGANSLVVLDEHGQATGELREAGAMTYLRRLLPKHTRADDLRCLRLALHQLAALGLTGAHLMDGDSYQLGLYAELEAQADLLLRLRFPMSFSPTTPLERLAEFANIAATLNGPLVQGGCIKLFSDGVVEAKTALLLAPYADGSGECGAANYEREHLLEVVRRADALGLQVIVHAIGDGAVRLTLDAFAAAQRANGQRDSRHRVEHVELLDPADLPRLRELGAIASMQPLHANFGYDELNPWRRLVGPERWACGFPWRELHEAAVPLAFGSDWPVVSADPLLGLQTSQTRIKLDWSHTTSSFPDQRISLAQALAAYTQGAAYAAFREHELGRLAPGMLADMVLLSDDIFALPPEQIATARAALTIVGGRVTHNALH